MMGMQNDKTILENIFAVSYKIKYTLSLWPSNPILSCLIKKNENLCYIKTYSNLIIIAKNRKEPQYPSAGQWLNKVVYPYNGTVLSNNKEQTIDWCSNMYESLTTLYWVKEARIKRIPTLWINPYNTLEKAKLEEQRIYQGLKTGEEFGYKRASWGLMVQLCVLISVVMMQLCVHQKDWVLLNIIFKIMF